MLNPTVEGTLNCSRFVVVLSSCNRDFSGNAKQQLYLSSDYGLECAYTLCIYTHIYKKMHMLINFTTTAGVYHTVYATDGM